MVKEWALSAMPLYKIAHMSNIIMKPNNDNNHCLLIAFSDMRYQYLY